MLYVVKPNDTLLGISKRHGTTIESIMKANVICNPNFIHLGQPLIIPDPNIELPKAGGRPYYVVNYGDTGACLAQQFSQSAETLAAINQLSTLNQITPGTELLVGVDVRNPEELYAQWNILESKCESLTSLALFHNYYLGTFRWEALGSRAVPYLKRLLQHPCAVIRWHTIMSLGRIGTGTDTLAALQQAVQDRDPENSELAKLALTRFQLIPKWSKRIHLTMYDTDLISDLSSSSPRKRIPKGTPVIVIRWNIPDPAGGEGAVGGLATFDLVQLLQTGETGYMFRAGYGASPFL